MKRVLVTSTNLMMRQFLVPHVDNLCRQGFQVEIACSHVGGCFEELEEIFQGRVKIRRVNLHRNPASPDNFKGLVQLKKIIKDGQFDLVWTNEPVMGVMTRLAAVQERKHGLKVMYMAHGFHFFKGAPLKNWLLYYPVEWLLAHWTDILVTINKEDYALAKKRMHAGQVEYIPGIGLDTKKFNPELFTEDKRMEIRNSLGLKDGEKMLLSVGELSVRKNHKAVIQALAQLNDPKIKYYICGRGELEKQIQELIDRLDLTDSVKLLGFRKDISSLCACTDLFVFPSLQEGLPVALMEAIASKVPVICSDIRGNTELVKKTALFGCQDITGIAGKIKEYLYADKEKEIEYNYENLKKFDLDSVMKKINELNLYSGGGVIYLLNIYKKQKLRKGLGIPLDAFFCLSVGELQKRKNHRVVIEALHRLKLSNIYYAIAGRGELKEEYENMIARYGLADNIKLLGFRSDIVELCQAADCFIHPSIREGFGIASMEAMASSLPLISADINGLRDYTEDGITGCCVNPYSVDEMCAAIMKMYEDRTFRRQCSTVNKEVSKFYDLERSERIIENIINNIIR